MFEPRVAFVVGGEPIPKGRPRAKAGQRAFTPKRTADAEKRVAAAFRATYPGFAPLTGRLMVVATFYRSTRHRVDTDNLTKLPTDALNGLAYVDDEQIEEIHAKRIYGAGDRARTIIRIFERPDPAASEATEPEKE
ncbi:MULTISPECIES: RusA family crossover junction endodeoxyribonuclease [unclassified Leucobacter]|uniref:RusA family crossover junction endodeoxyribonuclease n=1 Tax=unclassified Leucobacter TaxID=2621730 RepID=UPI00069A720A|nr:RusA family crossover junction endodeoxyribonuclease [Leucobacter sp. Ag1]